MWFEQRSYEGPHWNYKLYKYLCKFDEQITLPSDHPRASSRGTGSTRSLALCSLSGVYIYYGFFPLWRFSHTEVVIAIGFESIRRKLGGAPSLSWRLFQACLFVFRGLRESRLNRVLYDTLLNLGIILGISLSHFLSQFLQYHLVRFIHGFLTP